jgi:hypothetical protein
VAFGRPERVPEPPAPEGDVASPSVSPEPPPLRPPPRGSAGPSCSRGSTMCCRCSVPPVAAR